MSRGVEGESAAGVGFRGRSAVTVRNRGTAQTASSELHESMAPLGCELLPVRCLVVYCLDAECWCAPYVCPCVLLLQG